MQYHHVDVFTTERFGGNQLAVFTDARGLSAEQMQQIAREMNFSETTFVLPPVDPANHYRVRIFTPTTELPMAGHPTIGTAFVLHRTRLHAEPDLRLEEGVGLVPVTIAEGGDHGPLIEMRQPLPMFGPVFESVDAIAELLSLSPSDFAREYPLQVVTCGVPILVAMLRDFDAIKRLQLRLDAWDRTFGTQWPDELVVVTPRAGDPRHTVRMRMFGPPIGIIEDPATGAAAGPLGCYLVHYGLQHANTPLVIEQGYEMGRPSQLHVRIEQEHDAIRGVFVGGYSVYMGRGELEID